ncbi:MAG: hypothetical protein AMS16_03410 [Planctomycetes bacterium DG_58]|nr:MAG: hypothetical protein AMS16_03410 [Planctomycetes bacterium DG_58]
MTIRSRRIGKISICAGILVASAAFFLAGVFNPPRMIVAGQPVNGAAGSPVTAINIEPHITPNPVTAGQMVTVGGTVSIVGGPAQVKFTITYPMPDGGSLEGSFEVPLDENGLWGFTAPPMPAGLRAGTYTATITAEAEGASETETITFTINPAP